MERVVIASYVTDSVEDLFLDAKSPSDLADANRMARESWAILSIKGEQEFKRKALEFLEKAK